jgi:hypothetical protein
MRGRIVFSLENSNEKIQLPIFLSNWRPLHFKGNGEDPSRGGSIP